MKPTHILKCSRSAVIAEGVACCWGGAIVISPAPTQALCGKECREAKTYCKNWKRDNPGQECGSVRGAICIGKDWVKTKQVNWAWSACRLKGDEQALASARQRCSEFKTVWGGKCEVQSSRCKVR